MLVLRFLVDLFSLPGTNTGCKITAVKRFITLGSRLQDWLLILCRVIYICMFDPKIANSFFNE